MLVVVEGSHENVWPAIHSAISNTFSVCECVQREECEHPNLTLQASRTLMFEIDKLEFDASLMSRVANGPTNKIWLSTDIYADGSGGWRESAIRADAVWFIESERDSNRTEFMEFAIRSKLPNVRFVRGSEDVVVQAIRNKALDMRFKD